MKRNSCIFLFMDVDGLDLYIIIIDNCTLLFHFSNKWKELIQQRMKIIKTFLSQQSCVIYGILLSVVSLTLKIIKLKRDGQIPR